MSTVVKVVLIIMGCLALLAAVAVGAGVYWWRNYGTGYMEQAQQSRARGIEAGRHMDDRRCLTDAVARYKQDASFGASLSNNLFLGGCLETSRQTPVFCEGVPPESAFTETVRWRIARCEEAGITDSTCGNLFAVVQKHCETRREQDVTR